MKVTSENRLQGLLLLPVRFFIRLFSLRFFSFLGFFKSLFIRLFFVPTGVIPSPFRFFFFRRRILLLGIAVLSLGFLIGGIGSTPSQAFEVPGDQGSQDHLFGRALTLATKISTIESFGSLLFFEPELRSFFEEWKNASVLAGDEESLSPEEEQFFTEHPPLDEEQFLQLVAEEKQEARQVVSLGNPALTQLVMTKIQARLLHEFLGVLFSLGSHYHQSILNALLLEAWKSSSASEKAIEEGFGLLENWQQQDMEYLAFDQDISIAFFNTACMKLGALADCGKPGTSTMLWQAAKHFEKEGAFLQSGLKALYQEHEQEVPFIVDQARQEQAQAWRGVNDTVNMYALHREVYGQLDVPTIMANLPSLGGIMEE